MKYTQEKRPIAYIDESGFAHDMPRINGYSTIGTRCFGSHNWGAKGRANVIGALIGKTLLSISLFQCNINAEVFTNWVKEDLLHNLPVNSVIVMDNASFHKRKDMQDIIRKAGHTLEYLPPYSPDFSPIEHKWAQAKSVRRKHDCKIYEIFKNYLV